LLCCLSFFDAAALFFTQLAQYLASYSWLLARLALASTYMALVASGFCIDYRLFF